MARYLQNGQLAGKVTPIQVGGRWGAMILLCLRARPRRFGVLRRHLPPVSAKVLAETLRSMERDGFVRRRPVGGAPDQAVEYELSELGRSLLPVIDHAQRWGRAHLSELDRHRCDHDRAQDEGTGKPSLDAAVTGVPPAAATCPDQRETTWLPARDLRTGQIRRDRTAAGEPDPATPLRR